MWALLVVSEVERYDFFGIFENLDSYLTISSRLELCATSTDWRDAPDKRRCKSLTLFMLCYSLFEREIFRSPSVVPSHMPLKYPGSVMQLCARMFFLDRKTMSPGLERLSGHVVWSMIWKFYPMERRLRLERKVLI